MYALLCVALDKAIPMPNYSFLISVTYGRQGVNSELVAGVKDPGLAPIGAFLPTIAKNHR
jgi:hypothetical protein